MLLLGSGGEDMLGVRVVPVAESSSKLLVGCFRKCRAGEAGMKAQMTVGNKQQRGAKDPLSSSNNSRSILVVERATRSSRIERITSRRIP